MTLDNDYKVLPFPPLISHHLPSSPLPFPRLPPPPPPPPLISHHLPSSPLPSPPLTSQLLAADLTEEKQECVEKIKPLVEEMGPKVFQEPIIQVHMSMQRGYWVVDIMHHYG